MTKRFVADPEMGDDAIRAGTGKGWDEWVDVLDAWDTAGKPHAGIARHVAGLGVEEWWAQSVTVGYERIKGLRSVGQRRDGTFQGSASKTFPTPVSRLFAAWFDESERDRWLETGALVLRTAQEDRSARFDADDGILALWFTDKGARKSSVSVQVDGLASKADADAFRQRWKARLARLAAHLEKDSD